MTEVPLLLPVKADEATALAELVIQQLAGKPPSADQRSRLAARTAAMPMASIRPYWGSLRADPVHAGAYYLAADGLSHGEAPVLLRLAADSSPSSGLFPKAILIGRGRPGRGREVVVSSIPFGPADKAAIRAFANELDREFLPKPVGARPVVCVRPADPAASLPGAFEGFRRVQKDTGLNVAAIEVAPNEFEIAVWAAIRAGWTNGYTLGPGAMTAEAVRAALPGLASFTKFTIEGTVDEIESACDLIRQAKITAKLGREFDLEVSGSGLAPAAAADLLRGLRSHGHPARLLSVTTAEATEEMAEAVRSLGAILSVDAPGRWHWRAGEPVSADHVVDLASQARG